MSKRQELFLKWLDTFITEKGIGDAIESRVFQFTDDQGLWNYIPCEAVIENIKATSYEEQAKIQTTIVKIDFHNGDVFHYFEHLARALANNYQGVMRDV